MPRLHLAVPFLAILAGFVRPASAAPPCVSSVCGNASIMAGSPFWELDESRQSFSPQGQFRIVKLVKNGVDMQPHVDGFLLRALDGNGNLHPVWDGVLHVEQQGGAQFRITIKQGTSMPFMEGGHPPNTPLLPTYRMTYVQIVNGKASTPRNLCGENWTTVPRDALVFQGDRYAYTDGYVMAVGAGAQPWFNIGCKEDALWKLALMRHVEAAQTPAFLTSKDDRSAGLRAIRADYCGTGAANTVLGTEVDWANRAGWLTIDHDAYPKREAYWGPSGAICVDTPRLIDRDDLGCAKPYCHEVPMTTLVNAAFLTHIPD